VSADRGYNRHSLRKATYCVHNEGALVDVM